MISLSLRGKVPSHAHRDGSRDQLSYTRHIHQSRGAEGGEAGREGERNGKTCARRGGQILARTRTRPGVCAPSANPLPGQDAKSAECARLSDSSEGTHMMTSLTTAGSINERSSSPLSSLQQIVRSLLCWSHLAAAA